MAPLPLGLGELSAIWSQSSREERRTILFCGCDSAQGTSTIAYAFAQRAAAAGKRVLFVDFNPRASFTKRVLQLPVKHWNMVDPVDSTAYFEIADRNLTLLAAPVNLSFSLNEEELSVVRSAVARWKEAFDIIVADAAPLGRSNKVGRSTELLAAGFDCTFLVVLSGQTTIDRLQKAAERLAEAEVCVGGLIMNDRDMPDLRSELNRQLDKIAAWFPRAVAVARRWLERRRVFDIEF